MSKHSPPQNNDLSSHNNINNIRFVYDPIVILKDGILRYNPDDLSDNGEKDKLIKTINALLPQATAQAKMVKDAALGGQELYENAVDAMKAMSPQDKVAVQEALERANAAVDIIQDNVQIAETAIEEIQKQQQIALNGYKLSVVTPAIQEAQIQQQKVQTAALAVQESLQIIAQKVAGVYLQPKISGLEKNIEKALADSISNLMKARSKVDSAKKDVKKRSPAQAKANQANSYCLRAETALNLIEKLIPSIQQSENQEQIDLALQEVNIQFQIFKNAITKVEDLCEPLEPPRPPCLVNLIKLSVILILVFVIGVVVILLVFDPQFLQSINSAPATSISAPEIAGGLTQPEVASSTPTDAAVPVTDTPIPTNTPSLTLPEPTNTSTPTLDLTVMQAAEAEVTLSPTIAVTVPSTSTPIIFSTIANYLANLRSGPGEDYPTVDGVEYLQEIRIIGKHGEPEWYLLDNGGWISGSLIKRPSEEVPIVPEDATPKSLGVKVTELTSGG